MQGISCNLQTFKLLNSKEIPCVHTVTYVFCVHKPGSLVQSCQCWHVSKHFSFMVYKTCTLENGWMRELKLLYNWIDSRHIVEGWLFSSTNICMPEASVSSYVLLCILYNLLNGVTVCLLSSQCQVLPSLRRQSVMVIMLLEWNRLPLTCSHHWG